MKRLVLLVIGDGRDYVHEKSWQSAQDHLPLNLFDEKIVVDDRDHELGFAGAVQRAWGQVALLADPIDYVFHLEADFLFNVDVPLEAMLSLLERKPYLAQVSLKRQPCNAREQVAGGIVEADPDDFYERSDEAAVWTEHSRYFTTNPSVYPAKWCRMGWPQESESEGKFTHRLLQDPLLRFAIWGPKFAPPLVEHIGVRVGSGY